MDEAIDSMIRNLEQKTSKSLSTWIEIARSIGKTKHGEIVSQLKAEHDLTHGYANLVARRFLDSQAEPIADADGPAAALFAGSKDALKPVYDALVATVQSFGDDVELAPKKANVSIRRSKQFALFQPSTATRLDVGLILKGVPPQGRLEASGSFNAMFTHRVRVSKLEDVDAELKAFLKQAYDLA